MSGDDQPKDEELSEAELAMLDQPPALGVLLKRSLASVHPDFFSTILTPKADELVADSQRHGGREAATEFFRLPP